MSWPEVPHVCVVRVDFTDGSLVCRDVQRKVSLRKMEMQHIIIPLKMNQRLFSGNKKVSME